MRLMKCSGLFLFLAFSVLGLASAAGDDQPPKDEKKYVPIVDMKQDWKVIYPFQK